MRTRTVIALLLAACAAAPAGAMADAYTDASPPGANDFTCKPSAAHPDPLVLVHGLSATAVANWYDFSPKLASAGYCVFALTYGVTKDDPPPFSDLGGTMPMEDSEHELAAFIDRVLAATGAAQVDIVGHSEGSLMPDYYLRFDPDAANGTVGSKVNRYVAMTPLWKGTSYEGLAHYGNGYSAPGCGSCMEFIEGSDFINRMNSGTGPRVAGVTYTTIMTKNDELVQPYTNGYLEGATNVVLQDQCPLDPSEHLMEAADPLVYQDVLNALDPAHAKPVDCTTALGG